MSCLILGEVYQFTYESFDAWDSRGGIFSYPHREVVNQWVELTAKLHQGAGRELDFGYQLYGEFQSLNLTAINVSVNQPILFTAEEKSVLRLPIEAVPEIALSLMTANENAEFLAALKQLEAEDVYVGFYRNFLIAGTKQ